MQIVREGWFSFCLPRSKFKKTPKRQANTKWIADFISYSIRYYTDGDPSCLHFFTSILQRQGGSLFLIIFLQNLFHIGFHFPSPGKIKRLISNQLFQECSWSRHSVCQMGWTPVTHKTLVWFSNMLLISFKLPFVLADLKKSPIEEDFYLSCSWVLEKSTGKKCTFGIEIEIWSTWKNLFFLALSG